MAGVRGVELSTPLTHAKSEEEYADVVSQVSIQVDALAKSMEQFTIFRVPVHIRESKKSYYEPLVVSIGPYHHGKGHLRAMEDLKQQCLQNFLDANRSNNITEEYCLNKVKKREAEARGCYFESPVGFEEGDQFAKMLLVDGCFILHLMFEHYYEGKSMMSKNHFIRNDLLLLENQIPYFVLEILFELFTRSNKSMGQQSSHPPNPVVELAFKYLKPAMKGLKEDLVDYQAVTCKVQHLLHLHYCFLSSKVSSKGHIVAIPSSPGNIHLSSPQGTLIASSSQGNINPSSSQGTVALSSQFVNVVVSLMVSLVPLIIFILSLILFFIVTLFNVIRLIPIFILIGLSFCCSGWSEPPQMESQYTIPSATELQEAAVKLHKRESPRSLWDVHFDCVKGILYIPPVVVDEPIKPMLMNLVAFEQYAEKEVFQGLMELITYKQEEPNQEFSWRDYVWTIWKMWDLIAESLWAQDDEREGKSWKKFTAYALFMDCIVNTDIDAMTLRQQGIIDNMLGSEQAIADFFNQLCEGVNHEEKHYFSVMFLNVKKFCKAPWRRHKAKLMRQYFSNPWATISLMAGFLALALTIVQTVYAILGGGK